MTNRGLIPGLGPDTWKSYTPVWRSQYLAGSGSTVTTQPSIGNGSLTGRYLRFPSGLVVAQLQAVFGSTTDFGSAATSYVFSVPVPGLRSNSGVDLPIGTGLVTLGNAASPQLTQLCVPTMSDPSASSSKGIGAQSDEDNWVQGFCQRLIAVGVSGDANTPAFTSGVTVETVTHNLGLIGGFVPSVYDIDVIATNSPSTTPKTIYVDTITSTTFNVHVGTAATTTPLQYAWKIRAEPNTTGGILIGPNAPWTWAAGASISYQLLYEARR